MTSIFSKIKQAISGSSNKISKGIEHIFYKRKLDQQALNEFEELLISSDINSITAAGIIADLSKHKFDKEVDPVIVKELLAEIIKDKFLKHYVSFDLVDNKLNIILVCGVNGNGKTTTIGKLAAYYKSIGKKVAIAACDTFRAAAVDQLAKWAERAGATLISGPEASDPASIAYQAFAQSLEQEYDILFIDTAGRLQNYQNLMDELTKIVKILNKQDPTAPHHSLLVIDATTGQNAYSQVEQFQKAANITGLVVTKLDGTARAGVMVGIADKFSLPIQFIGIGEKIDDLKQFDPTIFSKALVDL